MTNVYLEKLPTIYHSVQVELTSEKSQQHYRYILLDRLAIVSELSLIYNEALQDTVAQERLAIIKRPELTHNLDSCPLLVCIAEPNEPIDNELLLASIAQIKNDYLTSKQYVCGFLSSQLMPEQLAEALLESCLSAGKALNRQYFPFYEPFTLDVLWHSYDVPAFQLGRLLPSDTRYCFVDTDGECRTFTATSNQDEHEFIQGFVNQTQRYHLLSQAVLYHLVVTWQELCELQNKALPKHALSKVIHFFYDETAVQLSNACDRRAYVLFSLQYGELMQSDELSELIKEVIDNDQKQGKLSELLSQQSVALHALRKQD